MSNVFLTNNESSCEVVPRNAQFWPSVCLWPIADLTHPAPSHPVSVKASEYPLSQEAASISLVMHATASGNIRDCNVRCRQDQDPEWSSRFPHPRRHPEQLAKEHAPRDDGQWSESRSSSPRSGRHRAWSARVPGTCKHLSPRIRTVEWR